MKKISAVVSLLLLVCLSWAQEANPAPAAEEAVALQSPEPVAQYHPGLIVNGTSFVDVRQVAAISGCRFDAIKDYYVKLIEPTGAEVICQMDGKIKGPTDLITQSRPPQIYSDICIFVPARIFIHLGHKITWDGKLLILTVDDTHKIPILDRTKWYAIVKPPQDVVKQTTPISYEYRVEQPAYTGDIITGGWQPPSSYSSGGGGSVHVGSYTRKDGTRVRAYTRSRPRR